MKILVVGDGTMGRLVYDTLIKRDYEAEITSKVGYNFKGNFDLIVDFSHPDTLTGIIKLATFQKIPVLIATTGYSEAQFRDIKDLSKSVPVLLSGNYSTGVILMNRLIKEATKVLGGDFDIEIIEKHHNLKADAPSGTAKMMLNAANEHLDYPVVYGRSGFCKRAEKEIAVHTVRGGTIVGEHEILFAGTDQVFTIKHEAHSKMIFVNGALKGIEWMRHKPVGLYSMEDVLFGDVSER